MNIFIPTLIIFLLCAAGIGIGLLIKGKPLEKKCSSEPDKQCQCHEGGCDKEDGNSK